MAACTIHITATLNHAINPSTSPTRTTAQSKTASHPRHTFSPVPFTPPAPQSAQVMWFPAPVWLPSRLAGLQAGVIVKQIGTFSSSPPSLLLQGHRLWLFPSLHLMYFVRQCQHRYGGRKGPRSVGRRSLSCVLLPSSSPPLASLPPPPTRSCYIILQP